MSERRIGIKQSDSSSPSLTKRKRTPSTAAAAGEPSHASLSWSREEVISGGGGLREESDNDEQQEEAADDEPAEEEGLISVGLSDESVLDCPICLEHFDVPVFQCGSGHAICSTCRDRVKEKFPFCSKKIGNVPCRVIESVLNAVRVHCSYKGYGCPIELSYSSKRSHQANCPYAPFGCPFDDCNFVGCQKRLSAHLNNAHIRSVTRLRFDHSCLFTMSRAENFVVFREEENGTLFILNKYDRMAVSCIAGFGDDRYAYALVARGKDSCLGFQSLTNRFENTPTSGCSDIAKGAVGEAH